MVFVIVFAMIGYQISQNSVNKNWPNLISYQQNSRVIPYLNLEIS